MELWGGGWGWVGVGGGCGGGGVGWWGWHSPLIPLFWASYQIRKIAGCTCTGNAGNDPDMHHGTCVTHVPWCMPGSLTSSFLWSRLRGKRSLHSRRMRNPQCRVSGKRPMVKSMHSADWLVHTTWWQLTNQLCELTSPRCPRNNSEALLLLLLLYESNKDKTLTTKIYMLSTNQTLKIYDTRWRRYINEFICLLLVPLHKNER